MNKECDNIQPLMVDALFGEEKRTTDEQLQRHLQQCPACAKAFAEMKGVLHLTKNTSPAEPPESYWPTFTKALNRRIEEATKPRVSILARFRNALQVYPILPQRSIQWASLIAVLFLGIIIGRSTLFTSTGLTTSNDADVKVSESVPPGMQYIQQTQRYLDRSNVLLLGLVNFDLEQDELTALNLSQKQEVASQLVEEAAVIKAALNNNKEKQLRMLVEELEKILLQIANLEAQENVPGIELIQHGVDHRALLLKINLESMKLVDQAASSQL